MDTAVGRIENSVRERNSHSSKAVLETNYSTNTFFCIQKKEGEAKEKSLDHKKVKLTE